MSVLILAAGLLVLALAVHAIVIAPRTLTVTTIEAPIDRLGRAFDGYVIAVISDIHYWRATDATRFGRIAAAVNTSNVDLIVLLGDYSRSFPRFPWLSALVYEDAFESLGRLLAGCRASDGMAAVLGNHDHYYNAARVGEWLRTLGARVLINDFMVLQRDGASLAVSGVGDALEDCVDSMGGARFAPPHVPLILLSHNPDAVLALSPGIRPDLVLSGHTHGGQVVLPWFGAPITRSRLCRRKTASGWVSNAIGPLYVTRGVGAQIPLRFRCPPELLIVRLVVPRVQQPA